MTLVKVNARDIILEAQVPDPVTPTWVEVGGLTTATVNLGENAEEVDVTDFDSEGAYESEVLQRGATIALEGRLLKDDTTGEGDPGQAQVTSNAGPSALGVASLHQYRHRYPMDTEWRVWTATTVLGEQGGGTNEKVGFAATIRRSGQSTTEAVI
jgi:hypothetical protein